MYALLRSNRPIDTIAGEPALAAVGTATRRTLRSTVLQFYPPPPPEYLFVYAG